MPGGKVSGAQWQDVLPRTEFGIDTGNRLFGDVDGIHTEQNCASVKDRNGPAFGHQLQQDRLCCGQQGPPRLFVACADGAGLFVLFTAQALHLFIKGFGTGAKLGRSKRVPKFGQFAFLGGQFGFDLTVLGRNRETFFFDFTGNPLAEITLSIKRLGRDSEDQALHDAHIGQTAILLGLCHRCDAKKRPEERSQ